MWQFHLNLPATIITMKYLNKAISTKQTHYTHQFRLLPLHYLFATMLFYLFILQNLVFGTWTAELTMMLPTIITFKIQILKSIRKKTGAL